MNKKFQKIEQLSIQNTYSEVVETDISRMVQTVSNDIKDTLGIPIKRKVAPLKEAKERVDKTTKSAKHEITE